MQQKMNQKIHGLSEKELCKILKSAKKYTDKNLMEISFTSPRMGRREKAKRNRLRYSYMWRMFK